jgi:glycosyltransferase involved in cell wall biosynthesis
LGVTLLRYALRPGENLIDERDKREEDKTRYILRSGTTEIIRNVFAMALANPLRTSCALTQAIKIGWRSDRGLMRHLAYLIEAVILAYWCRRDEVQHVHAHFGTNSALIAMLASRLSGIKYSFTAHGPEEFFNLPNIALTEAMRHCAFVVAISSYARSQLYRYVEYACWHKVHVIHCGLERTDFATTKSPALGRRFVCVARFRLEKGHLVLIEAAHQLAEQGQDFELVLVGDGEMRAEIEGMLSRYNLQTKVRITGWINNNEVRKEILAARALVQPSFAEGLPVVIMEAMALGRPIISTFVAGVPELVNPSEHGWLVPAGDVDALVNALRDCLCTPVETLMRMGEAAQKRALVRHDVSQEAVKLLNLFKESADNAFKP